MDEIAVFHELSLLHSFSLCSPGWFPASYVEAVDDLPVMTVPR